MGGNQKIYIYALEDPTRVSQTVYIGYTIEPEKRLARHLQPRELAFNRPKDCWIKSLLNRDVLPIMLILEEVFDGDWQEAERHYISYFKAMGMKLCNNTDGGDGTLGMKHSEDTKEKMRQKKLGTKQSEATIKKKMRQDIDIYYITELYNSGYSLMEIGELCNSNHETIKNHLQKNDIDMRGKYERTNKTKEKISQTLAGKIQSTETIEKRASKLRGRARSEETKQKISAAHKGKILTEEHKIKLSAAKLGAGSPTYKTNIDTNYLIQLYKTGKSLRAIGREVGLEHHAVKARLQASGII